ncbi:hypothetical protein ACIBTV_27750 [Micromonospora sp. NPDC049366]|uniref:hypothetical protein n=1 Tax=Micromonospora sp. NPDC049366 TaxID=3364271 RepID=UPI003790D459
MYPHRGTTADGEPIPGLAEFADAMRAVLRTRYDSQVDGPDALESWTRGDGYAWRWSTSVGMWTVTAGGLVDPRPLLRGPGGIWRVDAAPDTAGAAVVVVMLRAAGGLPVAAGAEPATAVVVDAPTMANPGAQVALRRPVVGVVRGDLIPAAPAVAEPLRAVLYTPSQPLPVVPAGHVPVRTASNRPDDDGRWEVTMPDGMRRHYDPTRSVLMPYETGTGSTALLLFDAPPQPTSAAAVAP